MSEEHRYRIESCLEESEVIGILGFAYHDDVMRRLRLRGLASEQPQIGFFGSAKNVGDGKRHYLKGMMTNIHLGAKEEGTAEYLAESPLLYQTDTDAFLRKKAAKHSGE